MVGECENFLQFFHEAIDFVFTIDQVCGDGTREALFVAFLESGFDGAGDFADGFLRCGLYDAAGGGVAIVCSENAYEQVAPIRGDFDDGTDFDGVFVVWQECEGLEGFIAGAEF